MILSEGLVGLLLLHGACALLALQVDVVALALVGERVLICLRNEGQRRSTRQFHHLIEVALCSGEPLDLIEVLCKLNKVGFRAITHKYLISESCWVGAAPGGAWQVEGLETCAPGAVAPSAQIDVLLGHPIDRD